jgi:NADH-quinone oxidoreductase subunit I
MGYWKEIVEGGWSLVEGMRVTVRRLWRPVVTVQYPRKQLNLSPAYRGHIELRLFADTGTHKCIACGACQRVCPSHVIRVQGIKPHMKSPKKATHYFIDFSRCSLCGLCVETCPTQTLQYSREYELEGDSRWSSVVDLIARQEQSRS